MAYTIKFHERARASTVISEIIDRARAEGFEVYSVEHVGDTHSKGARDGSRKPGYCVELRRIRLMKAKPYCGQHPGPCLIDRKKPTSHYLEWDDWVSFHGIVNDVLDKYKQDADVWSTPFDVKGRLWIRKGLRRRARYDYTEHHRGVGVPIRIWNNGTDDQFALDINERGARAIVDLQRVAGIDEPIEKARQGWAAMDEARRASTLAAHDVVFAGQKGVA